MSGKKVSLTGEVHLGACSVHTTVDALEALKCIGIAYGLYDHATVKRVRQMESEQSRQPAPEKPPQLKKKGVKSCER